MGALAAVAVAYLAQRGICPIEARVAAALGVISMPQMHWALRFGHLTPFLALAALGGFLFVRRRPYLAGLCFAFLILRPQYHVQWTRAEPVPAVSAIYEDLLKSGNWELMLREETSPSYRIRLSRLGPDGFITHWAMLDVSPQEGGSRISLDFMVTQGLTVRLN